MRILLLLPLLFACSPEDAPETACTTAPYESFVGHRIDDLALPQDRPVRIIRPGDPVTRDYQRNRLNVDLDDSDTATRVWCG